MDSHKIKFMEDELLSLVIQAAFTRNKYSYSI